MSVNSVLIKSLYWPLCRAYARYFVGDKPADAVYRFFCSLQFWTINGFWPDFIHPRRFSEKLWSRMLHDRNPKLTLLSDKLRAREYVAAKVGQDYLIPIVWKGNKPEEIPYDQLPQRFVIKTNHGCGYNIIVREKRQLNKKDVELQLENWLAKNYCNDIYIGLAWGYKNIKPCIIIEEFLEQNGTAPVDYKFWCFAGRTECITVHFDRFTEHKIRSFGRNLEPIEWAFGRIVPIQSTPWQEPQNFDTMLRVAESLAEGFGFMRIDLYSLENRVYFGEFTPYPGGGWARYHPARLDSEFGMMWKGR